ncbi:MAG: hypothetical protein J7453_10670 [Thermomicrobium sp.]|nr:hypothetical protein [Thermomicrobium sp.]
MLPEWAVTTSLLGAWLALLGLAVVLARLAQRLQALHQVVASTVEAERERARLGQPVPPLALAGPASDQLILGVLPAAPAVVLALSQRCPPCSTFWERLETLAASLAERGMLMVLAVPESDAPVGAARVPHLVGEAALAALGLSSFPSLAVVDERGHLRGRGVLRSVEEVPEIVSMLLQPTVNTEGKR